MAKCLLAICLFLLGSCSPSKVVENQLTPQERAVIRGAIDDIARGDTEALKRKMHPALAGKVLAAEPAMRRAMPAPPLQVSILNVFRSIGSHSRKVSALYQVHGRNGWATVRVQAHSQDGQTAVTAIYVQRIAGDPQTMNKFRLAGTGAAQWAVLIAAIAAFITTVAALVRIWRSGLFKKRWLWTIGALFGVMVVKVNWTTGALSFQPFYVQLFSASAFKYPVFAPWVISASLPVVALIALLRKRGPEVEPRAEEV